jgi:hypothetical protein
LLYWWKDQSTNLKALVEEDSLKFPPLHNIQPTPSHNQFVDDTLLMNTPIAQEATKLNSILTNFTEASGMALNLDKSQLYFFNTPMAIQNHIHEFWVSLRAPFRTIIKSFPSQERPLVISPRIVYCSPSPTGTITRPLDHLTL